MKDKGTPQEVVGSFGSSGHLSVAPELAVGSRVIAAGKGVGYVVEILPAHYRSDRRGRRVRVDFGHGRIEWTSALHVTVCR